MSFSCTDKDTLIAYVYGECDDATRRDVDAHLAVCAACAGEVGGFGRVRTALSEWVPPDRVGTFRLVREEEPAAQAPARVLRPARWWQTPLPALAKIAAGILLFAGGAALANLEVRYDNAGFSVRTGWQKAAPAEARPAAGQPAQPAQPVQVAPAPAPAAAQLSPAVDAPWRGELASLERQLRDDFRQQLTTVRTANTAAAPAAFPASVSADERRFLTYVQSMIDESANRLQLLTAYQINQVVGEVQAQRRADLVRAQQPSDRLNAAPASIMLPNTAPTQRSLFPVTIKK